MQVGETFKDYTILEEIKSGAQGTVFKARHEVRGRLVAIKGVRALHAQDPRQHERLKNEAQLIDRLKGRPVSLVELLDAGKTTDGGIYLAMEYLEGGTLRDELSRHDAGQVRHATPLLLRMMAAVAAGLGWLHDRGIVHLDLKPENLLFTEEDGAAPRLKVVDFGLARAPRQGDVGVVLGTIGYIAPEILRSGSVTTAADVYSLGVILYELLTGDRPLSLEDARAALRGKAATGLARLVLAMIARDHGKRPTMHEVAERLAALTMEPGASPRRWLSLAGVGVAVVALVALRPFSGPLRARTGGAEPRGSVGALATAATAPAAVVPAGTAVDAGPRPPVLQADENAPPERTATAFTASAPLAGSLGPEKPPRKPLPSGGDGVAAPPSCSLQVANDHGEGIDYNIYLGSQHVDSPARGTAWSCVSYLGQEVVVESRGYQQGRVKLRRGGNRLRLREVPQ